MTGYDPDAFKGWDSLSEKQAWLIVRGAQTALGRKVTPQEISAVIEYADEILDNARLVRLALRNKAIVTPTACPFGGKINFGVAIYRTDDLDEFKACYRMAGQYRALCPTV